MRTYFCPFWRSEKVSELSSTCEGAALVFTSNAVRRAYVYGYCAHPEGWKSCPIYKILQKQEDANAEKSRHGNHR